MKSLLESIISRIANEGFLNEAKKKACPAATGNLKLNLKNRQNAIDNVMYGPANPSKPGDFWKKIAKVWDIPESEAKSMRCGNCAAFDVTKKMKVCIQKGLTDNAKTDSWDTVNAGQLGYCHMLKFKCASKRTCKAWVGGGPIGKLNEGDFTSFFGLRDEEPDDLPPPAPRSPAEKWYVTTKGTVWKYPDLALTQFETYRAQDEWLKVHRVQMEDLELYLSKTEKTFDNFEDALLYATNKYGKTSRQYSELLKTEREAYTGEVPSFMVNIKPSKPGQTDYERTLGEIASVETGGTYNYKLVNRDDKSCPSLALGKYQYIPSVWWESIKSYAATMGIKLTGTASERCENKVFLPDFNKFLDNGQLQENWTRYYLETEMKPFLKKIRIKTSEFPNSRYLSDGKIMALFHYQGGPGAEHWLKTGIPLYESTTNEDIVDYLNRIT